MNSQRVTVVPRSPDVDWQDEDEKDEDSDAKLEELLKEAKEEKGKVLERFKSDNVW